MVGGTMSGYCATGSETRQTRPRRTVTIAMTLARIGRSMKNLDIANRSPRSPCRRRGVGRRRRVAVGGMGADLAPRDGLQDPLDDHPVVRLQPLIHDEGIAHLLAGLDRSPLDHVLVVDHQDVLALLVEADRIAR